MRKLLQPHKLGRGKKLFFQSFVVMSLMRLGLWLLPFSKLQELVRVVSQLKFLAFDASNVSPKAIVNAIERSSRYSPGQVKCLARALTASVLMSLYDMPHEVKIGVAKGDEGQIEAHAWIESFGQVILGNLPDLPRYVTMSASEKGVIL